MGCPPKPPGWTDGASHEFMKDATSQTHGTSYEKQEMLKKHIKSKVPVQETYINVGSLETYDEAGQQSEAWKRKRRRSVVRNPVTRSFMKSCQVKRVKHPMESNIIISILEGLFNVFLVLFVSIPITVCILFFMPFSLLTKGIYNLFSGHLQHACTSCRSNNLSAHDAQFFLQGNQSIIHSVLIIDGSIDLKRIRHTLSGRVIQAKTGSGLYMYPRLTQLVVQLPHGPTWYTDHKFNLNDHVYLGPDIDSEEQLQKYVARLLMQPLNVLRPLWEVIVLKGFSKGHDTVLICRLHQCITDGMSLLKILCQSLSDNQIMHIPQKPHFGSITYSMNIFRSLFVGPLTVLTWLCGWKTDKNLLSYCKPLNSGTKSQSTNIANETRKKRCCGCNGVRRDLSGRESNVQSVSNEGSINSRGGVGPYTVLNLTDRTCGYNVQWTASIPMNKVLRVKQVTRTCLNDIILASLAGALRKSLQTLGVMNPPILKVNIAVDLRSDSLPFTVPDLGNKASLVPFALPVEIEGAIPRIWRIRETLEEMKASADSVVSYCLVWWAYNFLPSKWASSLLLRFHSRGSLQYSSLPGPTSPLLLGGYAVKNIYNISPPRDPLNLSVTVFTYADRIHVSLTTRKTMMNARWLAKSILVEMERQCEQMSDTLSHRRLPGEQKRGLLFHGSHIHSSSTLVELQTTLAKVQAELQHVTEQYESQCRRGIHNKSRSSDLSRCFSQPSEGGVDVHRGRGLESTSSGETYQVKTRRFSDVPCKSSASLPNSHVELAAKVQSLKQEFTELLSEIRRRKNISEGANANYLTTQVRVLYVRNLALATTEQNLKDLFCSLGGMVERVKKMKDYAFVHFVTREEAEKAKDAFQGHILDGCRIDICWSKPVANREEYQQRKAASKAMLSVAAVNATIPTPLGFTILSESDQMLSAGRVRTAAGAQGYSAPKPYPTRPRSENMLNSLQSSSMLMTNPYLSSMTMRSSVEQIGISAYSPVIYTSDRMGAEEIFNAQTELQCQYASPPPIQRYHQPWMPHPIMNVVPQIQTAWPSQPYIQHQMPPQAPGMVQYVIPQGSIVLDNQYGTYGCPQLFPGQIMAQIPSISGSNMSIDRT